MKLHEEEKGKLNTENTSFKEKVSSLEESKASTEEATAEVNLEEVLDEAQETTPEIANTNEASSGEAETLKSKFQSAFSKENIKITY